MGTDISKKRLDVAILPQKRLLKMERTATGIAKLAKELAALSPYLIEMDTTGGLQAPVAAALAEAELPVAVAVVNPR